jgi:hypothetical protein
MNRGSEESNPKNRYYGPGLKSGIGARFGSGAGWSLIGSGRPDLTGVSKATT